MPILEKPRHEKMAVGLALGNTKDQSYADAGYNPHRGNASRLSANENIKARVAELLENGIEANDVTPDLIIKGLLKEAMEAQSDGARTAAWKTLAQVRAMLVQVQQDREAKQTDEQLMQSVLQLAEGDAEKQAILKETLEEMLGL